MSKKSYKQLKNRLYREIKRRIQAEDSLYKPVRIPYEIQERKIDCLRVDVTTPYYMPYREELIRARIIDKISEKMLLDDYIELSVSHQDWPQPSKVTTAKLYVAKPPKTSEGW